MKKQQPRSPRSSQTDHVFHQESKQRASVFSDASHSLQSPIIVQGPSLVIEKEMAVYKGELVS